MGGPIKYNIRNASGVTDAFLFTHVVPNIRQHFGAALASCLGKALMWGIFNDEVAEWLPSALVERVKDEYRLIRRIDESINPIVKVPLIVSGHEGTLHILMKWWLQMMMLTILQLPMMEHHQQQMIAILL